MYPRLRDLRETLIKLAALYKCSVDYLLGVSDKR